MGIVPFSSEPEQDRFRSMASRSEAVNALSGFHTGEVRIFPDVPALGLTTRTLASFEPVHRLGRYCLRSSVGCNSVIHKELCCDMKKA